VSGKFRYGSNFPMPGYWQWIGGRLFVGERLNEVRVPEYARLDLRVNRVFNYTKRRLTLFADFGASSRVGRVRLATAGSTGAGPKRRELTKAVAVTLDKALDKAYENKSLEEILDAPVAALAGVSAGDAEKLAAAFGIKTVRDLGSSKYFAVAQALVALGAHSG